MPGLAFGKLIRPWVALALLQAVVACSGDPPEQSELPDRVIAIIDAAPTTAPIKPFKSVAPDAGAPARSPEAGNDAEMVPFKAGGEGCAPMDAKPIGHCMRLFGYSWDGQRCFGLGGCACEGEDCDHLFAYDQPDACEAHYAHCKGKRDGGTATDGRWSADANGAPDSR